MFINIKYKRIKILNVKQLNLILQTLNNIINKSNMKACFLNILLYYKNCCHKATLNFCLHIWWPETALTILSAVGFKEPTGRLLAVGG